MSANQPTVLTDPTKETYSKWAGCTAYVAICSAVSKTATSPISKPWARGIEIGSGGPLCSDSSPIARFLWEIVLIWTSASHLPGIFPTIPWHVSFQVAIWAGVTPGLRRKRTWHFVSDRGSFHVFWTLGCVQLTYVINWHFDWFFTDKDRRALPKFSPAVVSSWSAGRGWGSRRMSDAVRISSASMIYNIDGNSDLDYIEGPPCW